MGRFKNSKRKFRLGTMNKRESLWLASALFLTVIIQQSSNSLGNMQRLNLRLAT